MSYQCEICGKQPQSAHKVSHSNRKTKTKQLPNLQRVHVNVAGTHKHIRVCTRCLRTGQVTKA